MNHLICRKNWLSESPDEYDCPAPMLGQDNQEVYGSLLGLDDATLENLQKEKVI
jgi:crotonobetainyl-CoA:carnitine CoA-transferase CaiB-like acyl-CoA transferase